jgi:hypothetical protein
MANVIGCPSLEVAFDVTGSIHPPYGRLIRVTPASGIMSASGPRWIIGSRCP